MKTKISKLQSIIAILFLLSSLATGKLIVLYPFDDSPNDPVSQHNATVYGNPDYVKGVFGDAINLNGNTDYIKIPSIRNSLSQFSFSLWFKANTPPKSECSFMCTHGTQDNYVHLIMTHWVSSYLSKDGYSIELAINTRPEESIQIPIDSFINTWRHVAVTCDGTTLKMYFDRQLVGFKNMVTKNLQLIPGQFLIGAWNISNQQFKENIIRHFDGSLDDVAVFDHALSEAEVSQLYFLGTGSLVLPPETVDILNELSEIESQIHEKEPQGAVEFLNEKIQEFEGSKKTPRKDYKLPYSKIALDPYWLLAQAKEKTDAPKQEVVQAYMQAAMQPLEQGNRVAALLWLYNNSSPDAYKKIIFECFHTIPLEAIPLYISLPFESSGDWEAFELFLDTFLTISDEQTAIAEALSNGLKTNQAWSDKFIKYCRKKSLLKEYVINVDTAEAINKRKLGQYLEAAKLYSNLMNICDSKKTKAMHLLNHYECLFQDGQYEHILQILGDFINENKDVYNNLTADAMLLQGKAYIQLGKTSKAIDKYEQIIRDCHENKDAVAEAYFYVGYCHKLQDKLDQATELLNVLAEDYPQSSFASKAKLCLSNTDGSMPE